MQMVTPRELLTKSLLLRTINCLDRQLIPARQIQNNIAEALPLELHQKLDGIATRSAGEAVIKLLLRRHRHRRLAVVMKRADTNEFPSLFFEHHVLAHNINDVGALFNGVDGAGV